MRVSCSLVLTTLFFVCAVSNFAQSTLTEDKLSNEDIIHLVKAGIAENLILAKIKSSNAKFDTTSNGLITLKSSGVSDSLILAMIEAASKATVSSKSSSSSRIFSLRDVVGKRKVFIECDDKKSLTAITKVLTKSGFEVVNPDTAELRISFDYEVHTTALRTPMSNIVGDIGNHNRDQKWGRFEVGMAGTGKEGVVFRMANQPRDGVIVKFIQKQAEDFTHEFVKEMRKYESNAAPTSK